VHYLIVPSIQAARDACKKYTFPASELGLPIPLEAFNQMLKLNETANGDLL
jgi:hypothetical protein